jgi:alpha-glucosidase
MQEPGLTTTESRKNPYSLLVAVLWRGTSLQPVSYAEGYIYLDDGETFNTTE